MNDTGSYFVPPRRNDPEILDGEGLTEEDLDRALSEIRLVNRHLGGISGVLGPLDRIARPGRRGGWSRISLLDVGTGSADIPRAVIAWAKRSGIEATVAATDLHPATARIARRQTAAIAPAVRVFQGDGFRLPFADGAFDAVTASLFLHHFEEDDAARLVREFDRVASRAVIINDLERHRIPWLAIRLFGWIGRASPMFRNDAPLSVLRGFTKAELRAIGEKAGVGARTRILSRHPYRLVLAVVKNESPS